MKNTTKKDLIKYLNNIKIDSELFIKRSKKYFSNCSDGYLKMRRDSYLEMLQDLNYECSNLERPYIAKLLLYLLHYHDIFTRINLISDYCEPLLRILYKIEDYFDEIGVRVIDKGIYRYNNVTINYKDI